MGKEITLYRVTKKKYERPYNHRTGEYGKYQLIRTKVDYRTRRSDVVSALRHAERENKSAERMLEKFGQVVNPAKYVVDVESAKIPAFSPMTVCDTHGLQVMLKVPGLTTDLTCVECILRALSSAGDLCPQYNLILWA